MNPLDLNYFYGGESEQFYFYRIPKTLFTDSRYKGVSVEAKVLYGLLLDRMGLSIRNGWLDSDGKVYIYFTLDDAVDFLGFGKDKTVRLFKELDQVGGIGLIERKKQGQGRPTKIYVKNFIIPEPSQTSEIQKSTLPEMAEVKTSEMPKSALPESRSQDFCKTDSNNTDKNNTELSDTDPSILPPPVSHPKSAPGMRSTMRMDEMDALRGIIKENIDYDLLLEENPYEHDLIDGYVELMVEACCSQRESIWVNQEDIPRELVRSRLLKLDKEHISYVMDCLRRNTTYVSNIKAYTLSALYNTPITMGQHYTSMVSHDMAQSDFNAQEGGLPR